jgi:DNA-binding transcriptional MerR regulator
VRIAELSQRSGVPIPTIKYYLREDLLPPGEFTSPNQARYGEDHVRRLRLIRALLEVGRLPIATIRELLAKADEPSPDLHMMLGDALGDCVEPEAERSEARNIVDDLVERRGWRVGRASASRAALAEAIATLRSLGVEEPITHHDRYADASERIAQADMDLVRAREGDPADLIYGAVIGTVIGDRALAALRRLAQEDASARIFGITAEPAAR